MEHVPWNARARLICGTDVVEDGVLGSCLQSWRRLDPSQRNGVYVVCDALVWLGDWSAPTPRLQDNLIYQVALRQGRPTLASI
jgi:hypothetical protein